MAGAAHSLTVSERLAKIAEKLCSSVVSPANDGAWLSFPCASWYDSASGRMGLAVSIAGCSNAA
jgi:hypothetical protein